MPVFHEMNANGLLELVMVADSMNNIIKKGTTRSKYEYKPEDVEDKDYSKLFKDYYELAAETDEYH